MFDEKKPSSPAKSLKVHQSFLDMDAPAQMNCWPRRNENASSCPSPLDRAKNRGSGFRTCRLYDDRALISGFGEWLMIEVRKIGEAWKMPIRHRDMR